MNHRPQHIVILGGGLGGLFTGALLSRQGFRVTVLERNAVAGGGLQSFSRPSVACRGEQVTFETGMHVLAGLQPGGALRALCERLGILSQLDIQPMPQAQMAQIYCADTGRTFVIPHGRQAFVDYLSVFFPAEAQGLRRYVDTLYDIVDRIDLFNLRRGDVPTEPHPEGALAVGDLIGRYIHDPELQHLLAFLSPMYAGQRDHTPAYIHALVNVLYLNGTCMLRGGSQTLADALCGVIRQQGGQILTRREVTHLEVMHPQGRGDRTVQYVETRGGERWEGDYYISSLHPQRLLSLCSPGAFPPAYSKRLQSLPNSYSAFKVFYELSPQSSLRLTSPLYIQRSLSTLWKAGEYHQAEWPHAVALYAGPDRSLMAVSPMPFSVCALWADTRTGHRGDDYETWKALHAERVTQMITQVLPDFGRQVVMRFAASPLSVRDWLGVPDGSLYGYTKDVQNLLLSHIPVVTKVSNLLLTGQNINLHGICGVPLTALQTAETLVKMTTGRNP